MKARTTIGDIARAAGVSTSTVSRVLNKQGAAIPISEATRERILNAAAELGYRPNGAARALASGRTQTVGVLVYDIADPYFNGIVRGIEDIASANHYLVLICSTDRNPALQREYLLRLASFPADGIIIAGGGIDDPEGATQIAELRRQGVAFVGVSRHRVPIPVVAIDDRGGARAMVDHLVGLGHRRIAFLAGSPGSLTSADREEGYRDGLRAASLVAGSGLVLRGDYSRAAGLRAADWLLDQAPAQRPTALLAANDAMAVGCLGRLRARGIAIPREISVVGFGDVVGSGDVEPPLTTVGIPLRDVGRAAMGLLLRQLAGDEGVGDVPVATQLVLRGSAGPLP